MTLWAALSVLALASASVPSVYFASKIWKTHPEAARLSAFLAAAFLVHATYHLMDVLGVASTGVLALESASAVMILVFALLYWREREAPA